MTVTKLSFFQCSFFDSYKHKKILSETDSHCRNVLIQSISPKKPEKSQHCILGFLVSGIVNSAKLMNGRRRSDLWCIVWMHFNSPQKPAVAGCLSDIMSGSRSSGLPTAAVVEAQRGPAGYCLHPSPWWMAEMGVSLPGFLSPRKPQCYISKVREILV